MLRSFFAVIVAILMLFQTAFAFDSAKKEAAVSNAEYAKKAAEIVYLYNKKTGVNRPDSIIAPLRIIGKTIDLNYAFDSTGAVDFVLCEDGRFLLQFSDSTMLKSCFSMLRSDPKIVYAERDAILYTQTDESENTEYMSWGAEALGMNKYSEYIQLNNNENKVTVAVIDSGVANLDVYGKRVINGYDFAQNDNDPSNDVSSNSHGTFLAGVIIDSTPNLNIDILSVKIVENKYAYLINAVNGIYYAVDNGADIINFSLCGQLSKNDCQSLEEAVNYAVSKGVTFVTCASNQSSDTVNFCPAHVEDAITASAVNNNLEFLNGSSNYGKEVDICAPGGYIKGYKADGTIQSLSGTSVSAAYVSACAAMFKLMNPECNPHQIQSAIKASCKDLGEEGFDIYYGYGIPQMSYFISDETVYAQKITVDKTEIVLDINETIKINAEVLPADATNKSVNWHSENPDIAEVDERGNVTAVAYGSTEIRAVTADGKIEAVSKVTVSEPASGPYIIGININKEPDKKVYTYKVDEEIELSGIKLEAVYSDNNKKPVTDIENIIPDGYDCKQTGEQIIKISYGGFTAEYSVEVEYAWWQWIIRILLLGFIWY